MKKGIGLLLLVGSLVFAVLIIIDGVRSNYKYSNEYSSYWHLADKSSTIEEKSRYINIFITKLENSGLVGTHNALYFPTDNNSFDRNLEALKSLGNRLETIKTMNMNSFEYQTAIQQITAQEQGEADEMLNVLEGCWYKINYYYLWNGWLILLWIFGTIGSVMLGLWLLSDD